MATFTDPYGGTGQIVNGEFVAYASEEEAQAMKVSGKTFPNPVVQSPGEETGGMSVKAIKAKLDELKVKYDSKAKKADLEALLAQVSQQQQEQKKQAEDEEDEEDEKE